MKIVICGRDRIGKDTQAELLSKALNCKVIHFPNEEYHSGQVLRKIINKVEGYPFEANSIQALQILNRLESIQDIDRAEEENGNVILCRFTMSGIVYALADGLPERWIRKTVNYVPAPDVTFVLYGEPYAADTGIYSNTEFQQKIADLYLQELKRAEKRGRRDIIGIDVNGKTIEEVHEMILAKLPDVD